MITGKFANNEIQVVLNVPKELLQVIFNVNCMKIIEIV